jgi:hypothetical protein
MAGMRLDIREEALKPKARGTPIIPGDPANSEVVQRIFAADGQIMPPASVHKELTAEQKDLIRRWIAEGAKYEGHWAYQPVTHPDVPEGGAKVLNPSTLLCRPDWRKGSSLGGSRSPHPDSPRDADLTGYAPEPAQ